MTDRRQTDNNNAAILTCKCNLQEVNLQGLWIGLTNKGFEK